MGRISFLWALVALILFQAAVFWTAADAVGCSPNPCRLPRNRCVPKGTRSHSCKCPAGKQWLGRRKVCRTRRPRPVPSPYAMNLGINVGDRMGYAPQDLNMIKSFCTKYNVKKIKFFYSKVNQISGLAGYELMIGMMNSDLAPLASQAKADQYTATFVKPFSQVKSVAVGNEPYAQWHGASYCTSVISALRNLRTAFEKAGVAGRTQLVVPMDYSVLFNTACDLKPLLSFLQKYKYPFMVNLYPYYACKSDMAISDAFCMGMAGSHGSMLQSMIAMTKQKLAGYGFPGMPFVIGEIGWESLGGQRASMENMRMSVEEVRNCVASKQCPPAYWFVMEDGPGTHYGLLAAGGAPKFQIPRLN